MTNYVYIATSLDGFIATADGGLDWLEKIPNPDGSDFGYADFMSGIDALVMGRNTYEKVLSFGVWSYDKPVFVLSNTLDRVSEEMTGKAEVVKGEPREVVADLNSRGYRNLYIDGGKVIQSFLKADRIDEMIITRLPVLLGDGVPLFGSLVDHTWFKHINTEILCGEMVQSHYTRKID